MNNVYALMAEGPNDTLAMFGNDPWWIILIKAVAAFAGLVVLTLLMIWFERKAVAWMQVRPGPNRHGPFGILQSLADGLKLAFKEDLIPAGADKIVFILAPVISTACAITAFSIIPLGPEVNLFGVTTPLQLTDLEVGVLLVLACSALGVYGIVLGGWASGSTYSLLGSLRAAAQVISYEIAMGLSIVAVFLTSGTLSTSGIVAAQQETQILTFGSWELHIPGWYALLLLPSFIIFCISVVGETNRAPFDLPEAESELVGGFHTEYSSLKFALFFLAEYINMVTVSAMAVTLFLGGWQAPFPAESWWPEANQGWWPLLWFFGKVAVLLFGFVWLRGTLPRFRYDQFMRLGWKVLVPVNLVWIVALAGFYAGRASESLSTRVSVIGGVGLLVLLALMFWPSRAEYKPPSEPDIGLGGFPVPPMDLEVPPSPGAKKLEAKREPVSAKEGGE